ncbi:MAG: DUF2279 domain-containing protein [Deltaproteobacteria bacterium]|nr:DUF2279 domain-containing protein [Deltaproteobacteria bacterium]
MLRSSAAAGPSAWEQPAHDPHAATTASAPEATPWIDLAPSKLLEGSHDRGARSRKVAAVATLAGLYAGFTGWTYFAWYRKHHPLAQYKWGCFALCEGADGNIKIWSKEGWFASTRYAGGADKLGHAWATMGLARLGTEMLNQWGGYDRTASALIGAGLAELLFFGVELKDGAYYEFSFGDLTFNTIGAGLAIALSLWPRLDELFDYRVEYWPSAAYRAQFTEGNTGKNLNIAEDYSGETYLLAFHLGGIHRLRDARWGTLARFVDIVAGFGARGYKPEPPPGAEKYKESQIMYLGISLNAQGIFDYLFDRRAPTLRKVTHGLFEMFNVPFGSLPVLRHEQYPTGAVMGGGA